MKKILLLNHLKDVPYWGLTTHALNVFPRLPESEFESYAFFSNPSFVQKSFHQLKIAGGIQGVFEEIKVMRKLTPDILYGTGSITEFFVFLFRPRRAKYMVAWHGPYDKAWLLDVGNHSFRAHVSFWIATYLLGRADYLACDTEFIARSLRAAFPGKPIVITLEGVDGEFYFSAKKDRAWLAEKLGIAQDGPVFVFIGHLIRRKRPELFAGLARRMPEASFVMVGREGLYSADDVKKWQEGASNLLWVPSSLTREEMPKLLASSSGLIFPSLDEPFGFAVIEAMASGAVVVATRSGSLPELIEEGKEGFLIGRGDGDVEGGGEIERFVIAAKKIIVGGSAIDDIRKQARTKTERFFTWPDVAKRYEEAFRMLINS